eukprot:m.1480032 g.1480032  ORF g.1480032 m.1480032 type:complete len:476 (+) comp25171_c2_seq21:3209-4636(+)
MPPALLATFTDKLLQNDDMLEQLQKTVNSTTATATQPRDVRELRQCIAQTDGKETTVDSAMTVVLQDWFVSVGTMLVESMDASAPVTDKLALLDQIVANLTRAHLHGRSLPFYTKILDMSGQEFGPKSIEVAAAHTRLGETYGVLHVLEKALEHHTRALEITQEAAGDTHPTTIKGLCHVGAVYAAQGRPDTAMKHYAAAVDIVEAMATPETRAGAPHDATDVELLVAAFAYNGLATAQRRVNDVNNAILTHNKALVACMKAIGSGEHHATASTYLGLGLAHIEVVDSEEDLKKATEFLNIALRTRLKAYGDTHPEIADVYDALGRAFRKLNNYDRALDVLHTALSIRRGTAAATNLAIACTYNELGRVHSAQGHFDKARHAHEQALAVQVKILSAEHPDVTETWMDLGSIALVRHGTHVHWKTVIIASVGLGNVCVGCCNQVIFFGPTQVGLACTYDCRVVLRGTMLHVDSSEF